MSDWLKKVRLDNQPPGDAGSQDSGKPEGQQAREPEKPVNLTVKVPSRKLRDWWVAQARLQGTNLTQVMTDYLRDRFGEPPG